MGTDVLVLRLHRHPLLRSRHFLSARTPWRTLAGVTRLSVRVTPRAARDSIDGFDDHGVLRVRVTAPPADGQANAALIILLSRVLDLPSRDIVLVSGVSARQKLFDVPLTGPEIASRVAKPGS